MKKNYVVGFAGLFGLFVILSSNSSGVGTQQSADKTGSPVSSNTCGQCHNGGSFSASTEVKLKNAAGTAVTEYKPGEKYTLELTVKHTGATRFGVQSVALFDNNATAGKWATKSSNAKLVSVSGRTYGEQTSASTSNVFTFDWTGPVKGSGKVTFYASGLAANGDGGTGGDMFAKGTPLAVKEAGSTSIIENNAIAFKMYPNPAVHQITIENSDSELKQIEIYDISGKMIQQKQLSGVNTTVDLSGFASGTYFVKYGDKGAVQRFVKH